MKTIKELHSEGLISNRVYNIVARNIERVFDEKYFDRSYRAHAAYRVILKMRDPIMDIITIEDLFNLFSEDEMMSWRTMGQKTMDELKGLL